MPVRKIVSYFTIFLQIEILTASTFFLIFRWCSKTRCCKPFGIKSMETPFPKQRCSSCDQTTLTFTFTTQFVTPFAQNWGLSSLLCTQPGFHPELTVFHCQPSWSRGMNASFYFIKKNELKPSELAEEILHLFCAFLSCRHSAKDHLTKLQQDLGNNSRKGSTWWALVPCWAHSCLGTAAPELLNLHTFLWKEGAGLKSGLVMEK